MHAVKTAVWLMEKKNKTPNYQFSSIYTLVNHYAYITVMYYLIACTYITLT